ncbi:MAG: hypothetical protein QM755_21330 [Luteolibacter sp.]
MLYAVSSVPLLPVLVAVVLLAVTLAGVGGVVARRRTVGAAGGGAEALGIAEAGGPASAAWMLATAPLGLGRRSRRRSARRRTSGARRRVAILDADVAAVLGRAAFVARVGPMLGLLGTLIPFGPVWRGCRPGTCGRRRPTW